MRIKLIILIKIIVISNLHSQTGKISGTIFDNNNEKLPYSSVEILKINDKVPFNIYSNENGYFLTPKISFGFYQLTYFCYGFEKK